MIFAVEWITEATASLILLSLSIYGGTTVLMNMFVHINYDVNRLGREMNVHASGFPLQKRGCVKLPASGPLETYLNSYKCNWRLKEAYLIFPMKRGNKSFSRPTGLYRTKPRPLEVKDTMLPLPSLSAARIMLNNLTGKRSFLSAAALTTSGAWRTKEAGWDDDMVFPLLMAMAASLKLAFAICKAGGANGCCECCRPWIAAMGYWGERKPCKWSCVAVFKLAALKRGAVAGAKDASILDKDWISNRSMASDDVGINDDLGGFVPPLSAPRASNSWMRCLRASLSTCRESSMVRDISLPNPKWELSARIEEEPNPKSEVESNDRGCCCLVPEHHSRRSRKGVCGEVGKASVVFCSCSQEQRLHQSMISIGISSSSRARGGGSGNHTSWICGCAG